MYVVSDHVVQSRIGIAPRPRPAAYTFYYTSRGGRPQPDFYYGSCFRGIRSGVRIFGCRPGGPLRRVPGPGTPAALPARHTATALTPPQTSWMRSRCPAVRTLHYAEPMRCCDLPRCLHSQAHVCPSHGLATPSHRRVPKATPRCPATCLTSRARAYAATRQECMRLPGLPLCSHGKPPYASPHANVMSAARHP